MDGESVLGYFKGMSPDWNRRSILRFLAEGCTLAEAREEGRPNREHWIWLHHPFRGKRPPTGTGRGGNLASTMGGGER